MMLHLMNMKKINIKRILDCNNNNVKSIKQIVNYSTIFNNKNLATTTTIDLKRINNNNNHIYQQYRNVSFLEKMNLRFNLVNLKKQIDSTPNNYPKLLEYIQTLVIVNPKDAIIFIERGWANKSFPMNETVLREYFKAIGLLNKFDSINITALLALLNKNILDNNATTTSTKDGLSTGSGADISQLLLNQALLNKSSTTPFTAGLSPKEPLYVSSKTDFSWSNQAWNTLRMGVLIFMLASFVGTFFDERTAGGAAAGISSRMGMSSIVKQAEISDKSFDDVVGVDEAKGDLQEIVMYLKDPKRFTRLGGKLPKGVLLTGPPGTGKTLLARAIAGEAKVPFFHASGSEFEEMYVGVGAKRVRELFDVAKSKSPCIIFIDEIDAIGGSRNLKDQSAMKMTLNQLLVEMDGFQQNNGIIVIAATNFPDSLDSALIRPGRFDKHVDVPMPDIKGRKAILELYGRKIPLDKDVDLEQLARGTPGFSGAELFNLMNQAALKSSIENLKCVSMKALEYAKDKIMMGAERRSAVISPETLRMTAFHEAGHALVAIKTDGADPVHKATIMPRGRSLGMVMQLPDGDQTSMSRKQMLARLDVCMGGRVAEEIVFGSDSVTSGASNDIMQATRLAKAMVTQYGLSEKVGIIFIDDKGKQSSETQTAIDDEVKDLLTASYQRAHNILETYRKELDTIATGLVQFESLSGSEIVDLINGKQLIPGKRSQLPSRALKNITPPQKVNPTVGGGGGGGGGNNTSPTV